MTESLMHTHNISAFSSPFITCFSNNNMLSFLERLLTFDIYLMMVGWV